MKSTNKLCAAEASPSSRRMISKKECLTKLGRAGRFGVHASAYAILFGLVAFGCGDPGAYEDMSPTDIESMTEPLYLYQAARKWPGGVVNVCFGRCETDDTAETCTAARSTAKSRLLNQWGRYSQLEFRGWNDCSSEPYGTTLGTIKLVLQTKSGGGHTYLSYRDSTGALKTEELPGYSATRETTSFVGNRNINSLLLHEIGHALGFLHEYARSDDPSGSACGSFGNSSGTKLTSYYDANSVMDYSYACNSKDLGLSPGDVEGVQSAYGRPISGRIVGHNNECLKWGSDDVVTSAPCKANYSRFQWDRFGQDHYIKTADGKFLRLDSDGVLRTQIFGSPRAQFGWRNFELRSLGNLCTSSPDSSPAVGDLAELQKCTGASSQRWTPYWSSSSTVQFKNNADPAMCLIIPNATAFDGKRVEVGACGGAPSNFSIRWGTQDLLFGNMCVDIVGKRPQAGAGLELKACSNAAGQNWLLRGAIESQYVEGTCIVPSGQTEPCDDSASQNWEFYP